MISLIGDFFGFFMYVCYRLVHNYGLAIILFTVVTRIIMLPITIMVQKNSIKMVKMYPDLNKIKAKYYGNQDIISEEQIKLYKENKYNPMIDLIPVLLQLVILMGVVDVIYKPLHHILRMEPATINELVNHFVELTKANPEAGSLQVQLVSFLYETVNRSSFIDSISNSSLLDSINSILSLDLHFCGFDMGVVPATTGGISIVIPIVAGLSALLMCFTQNKSNVLQSEQSFGNKLFTLLLSVGLSLYLGFFVPAGVGFYWILGNLFSIVQMYILNVCINPKNYIDYEALEESRGQLNKVIESNKAIDKSRSKEELEREKADYKRFNNTGGKQIVFYSEKNGFYKYYKDIIEYILRKTDIVVHYITSDFNDEVLKLENEHFKVYYLGNNKLIPTMLKMEADIVVMTTPDLQKYHIKRSIVKEDVEYVYIDHAINSFNMMLRPHAVDNFDTIFCANYLICDEMRAQEKVYNLPAKNLVEYGYCLIDNMIKSYEEQKKELAMNSLADNSSVKKTILVAPSWHNGNIMESCIRPLLDNLKDKDFEIIVRPHPQYVRHNKAQIDVLKIDYAEWKNIDIQTDFSSNSTVFNADVLISDWSGIAYEYSFTTLRPTLYINTPMKVMNENYKDIDVEPFDLVVRDKMGYNIDVDKIDTIVGYIDKIINKTEFTEEAMLELRKKYLFNVGKSASVAGNYLIRAIINKSKK